MESRDADGVLQWYQPDATLTLLDRDHPPATPRVLTGIDEIGQYFRDVCDRAMEHDVRDLVVTSDRLAYTEHCRYPDGTAVVCVAVAHLTDGLIQEQTGVQAWDS
jgi:hypothetical protein